MPRVLRIEFRLKKRHENLLRFRRGRTPLEARVHLFAQSCRSLQELLLAWQIVTTARATSERVDERRTVVS